MDLLFERFSADASLSTNDWSATMSFLEMSEQLLSFRDTSGVECRKLKDRVFSISPDFSMRKLWLGNLLRSLIFSLTARISPKKRSECFFRLLISI